MTIPLRDMQKKVEALRSLPSSPAVLKPLLDVLHEPPDKVPIDKVVKLVSYEKTIAAQLLRIANSPLYGRTKPAESIQAAIFTLGIDRKSTRLNSSHALTSRMPSSA